MFGTKFGGMSDVNSWPHATLNGKYNFMKDKSDCLWLIVLFLKICSQHAVLKTISLVSLSCAGIKEKRTTKECLELQIE